MKRIPKHKLQAVLLLWLCAAFIVGCTHAIAQDNDAPPATQPATQPAGDNTEASNPAHDLLGRIEDRAAKLKTITANLRRTRINEILESKFIQKGELFYSATPPRKFAAHITTQIADARAKRTDLWYIYDGRTFAEKNITDKVFRIYSTTPEGEETEAEALELGQGPFALPLNVKKDQILKTFDVSLISPKEGGLEDTVHLQLIPQNPDQVEQSSIDIWYNQETLLPVMVVTFNEDEEIRETFIISNTEIDADLPGGVFDTTPPKEKGWTVQTE
ncbi:LolA family protein [Poriferisphaera sp. WC338]|uniref:LolA family protein n=1 Tax=Poriferisphaera sp. WC338 TaxID=3425129 RepID=UPI003D8167CB